MRRDWRQHHLWTHCKTHIRPEDRHDTASEGDLPVCANHLHVHHMCGHSHCRSVVSFLVVNELSFADLIQGSMAAERSSRLDQRPASHCQLRFGCGRFYTGGSSYRAYNELDHCCQYHEEEQDSLQIFENGRDSRLGFSHLF